MSASEESADRGTWNVGMIGVAAGGVLSAIALIFDWPDTWWQEILLYAAVVALICVIWQVRRGRKLRDQA